MDEVTFRPGQDADTRIHVWSGHYKFDRDDPFFIEVVRVGQKYVDRKARGLRPSESAFREQIDALREWMPSDGAVLVDELEHRWANPDAPRTLYVITCELCVHESFALVAANVRLGQKAIATKVGRAARSLAPRLSAYTKQGFAGVGISPDTLTLRVVIYGHGPEMVAEGDLIRHAATTNAVLIEQLDALGRRHAVTSESYAGDEVVDALRAFAQSRIA